MEIYLDNAATTKPFGVLADSLKEYTDGGWYNPSSLYSPAAKAHTALNEARRELLDALNAKNGELVFTSGGTESNHMAVYCRNLRKKHLIFSAIEHPSIYETAKTLEQMGFETDIIQPDADYTVQVKDVASAVREDTALVSIMHVNNETGAVNDIAAISNAVKNVNPETLFHSDGVQAFCKLPFRLGDTAVDLYSISAHKLHALKGTGALYAKTKRLLKPVFVGGGQESGFRSGTENTFGIFAFQKACMEYMKNFKNYHDTMLNLRGLLKKGLENMEDVLINSAPDEKSAPHILNASVLGVRAEVLLHALEKEGIYIGTGSACSSKKLTGSRVLKAMGFDNARLESAVRISLSPLNTEEEIYITLEAIETKAKELRKYKRR